jgi:hypothetical protein
VEKILKKKGNSTMLFGKTERKRTSATLILAVGGLAMIGAAGMVRKGKCLVEKATGKMKNIMKKKPSDIC